MEHLPLLAARDPGPYAGVPGVCEKSHCAAGASLCGSFLWP